MNCINGLLEEKCRSIDAGEIKVIIFPEIPLWFVVDKKGLSIIKTITEQIDLEKDSFDLADPKFSNPSPPSPRGYIKWVKKKINELRSNVISPPFSERFDSLVLEITDTCNLRCPHCYVESASSKHNNLSSEDILRAIREAYEIGIRNISLTGGEIFTRSDIFEILDQIYAISKDMRLYLYTNGTLLTENMFRQMNFKQKLKLIISLDGSSPEIHNRIRGKNSFERTIRSIELAREFNYPVVLQCTIFSHNINDYKNLIEFAEKLGVEKLIFNPLQMLGRLRKNVKLKPSVHELARLDENIERFVKSRCEKNPFNVKVYGPLHWARTRMCYTGRWIRCSSHPSIHIFQDGSISFCQFYRNLSKKLNIKKISLAKAISSWEFTRIKKLNVVDHIYACQSCTFKYICGGGCRGIANHYGKNFFDPDPTCQDYKRAFVLLMVCSAKYSKSPHNLTLRAYTSELA